jgi:hypothetical protein
MSEETNIHGLEPYRGIGWNFYKAANRLILGPGYDYKACVSVVEEDDKEFLQVHLAGLPVVGPTFMDNQFICIPLDLIKAYLDKQPMKKGN